MTTDIIEINNFVVLIEQSNSEQTIIQQCEIDGDAVGFAFYGSGNVELEIKYENHTKIARNTTGLAISFFGNSRVAFSHKIEPDKPLQSISIFTKLKHLHTLPQLEHEAFKEYLPELIHPNANFVEGPGFYMTPHMQNAVQKVMTTSYSGNTRLLFLKSQVNELLSHFFAYLADGRDSQPFLATEREKLEEAKNIITRNMSKPPTLNELAKLIGLNNNKLKKNFKELFGVPVFKFLQEERLKKAYELLSQSDMPVQEAAWHVGYESLGSFSNAFQQKFGIRPADLKKQFFSNKS